MVRSFEGGGRGSPIGSGQPNNDRSSLSEITAPRSPAFGTADVSDLATIAVRSSPSDPPEALGTDEVHVVSEIDPAAPLEASSNGLQARVSDETTAAFTERPVPSQRSARPSARAPQRDAPSYVPPGERRSASSALPRPHRSKIEPPRIDEQYRLSEPFAAGGMATIHLGVREGDPRVYAIKRLHADFGDDEYFGRMLLDEAAIAARIRHHNVVTMYGAGIAEADLMLVMDYVAGLTIADLIRAVHPALLPARMVTAILADALRGLHAAHETRDERGRPLNIIHRDVSPQNVHLGADGVARILDFGVAKAAHRAQTTRAGELKGKMAYMAPEQLGGRSIDRRVDLWAASVVLWEALTGAPLFHAESEQATMARVLEGHAPPPSQIASGLPREVDAVVARGLALRPQDRFDTALDMAEALDALHGDDRPPSHEIAAWLGAIAAEPLREQWDLRMAVIEGAPKTSSRRPVPPRATGAAASASTRIEPLRGDGPFGSSDRAEPSIARSSPSSRPPSPLPVVTEPSQGLPLAWMALALVVLLVVLIGLVALTRG